MSKRIVIRKAGKIVDVFFGEEGWEKDEWARFIMMPGKFLKFLRGTTLSDSDYQAASAEVFSS